MFRFEAKTPVLARWPEAPRHSRIVYDVVHLGKSLNGGVPLSKTLQKHLQSDFHVVNDVVWHFFRENDVHHVLQLELNIPVKITLGHGRAKF